MWQAYNSKFLRYSYSAYFPSNLKSLLPTAALLRVTPLGDGGQFLQSQAALALILSSNIFNSRMHARLIILHALLVCLWAADAAEAACDCLNGGVCVADAQTRCHCAAGFLGERCQLAAREISSELTALSLSRNYSYLYFLPREVNYYKLMFSVCMRRNPSRKHTLFYIETERNDGSLREFPSLFETAKIVLEEDSCTSFSTHYISIKRKDDQSFRKIVVGLKVMEAEENDKYLNTYYSPLQSLETTGSGGAAVGTDQSQDITIRMSYEVYLRTSYYGTFMILFTAFVMLLALTSLITFLRKKYAIEPIDVEAMRLTAFDLHYLARSMRRNRRRNFDNPEERTQFRSKLALSNLQLFMPVAHYEVSESMFGEEALKEAEVCSICLLEFEKGEETRVTPCSHRYHRDCIDNWWETNMSCPICRRNLDFSVEMRQFYCQYMRNELRP